MTDYEALDARLRAKVSSPMPCPVCAANSWDFIAARLGLWPLDPPIDVSAEGGADDDEIDDDITGFWPLVCTNCGFTRLFHVATLVDDSDASG